MGDSLRQVPAFPGCHRGLTSPHGRSAHTRHLRVLVAQRAPEWRLFGGAAYSRVFPSSHSTKAALATAFVLRAIHRRPWRRTVRGRGTWNLHPKAALRQQPCTARASLPVSEVQAPPVEWPACPTASSLSEHALPGNEDLRRGVLPNGLRFVVLRHPSPSHRFEAHLDIHAGSVDEQDHQQGMAHILEHICFLGSPKRRRLIGTGARSNAITDFQHTVYHVHSPVTSETGTDMLTLALEALQDVAFATRFSKERLEQERKAVLNEMQQVNTLEYRIETWTLAGLHSENQLGRRFPIGLEEQIRAWSLEDCKKYYDEWYHPGNATLYLVGDMPEDQMLNSVERVFASTPPKELPVGLCTRPAWGPEAVDPASLFRRRLPTPRPSHLHAFSVPMVGTDSEFTAAAMSDNYGEIGFAPGLVTVIQNELMTNTQIYLYAKAPVRPLRTLADLRYNLLLQLVQRLLRLRILIRTRYERLSADVKLDHSDSFREGCAVTSVQVTLEDSTDWRYALSAVVQELRAVVDHGITEGELHRFCSAFEKHAETEATEEGNMTAEDLVTKLMNSDTFGHMVMRPRDVSGAQAQVIRDFNVDEVKAAAKWMFGFLTHYGSEGAAPPSAVVMCMPTRVRDETGAPVELVRETEEDVREVLKGVPDKDPAEALKPLDIPDVLCPEEKLQRLLGSNYVDTMRAYLAGARRVDASTGVVRLRLPNGARVNYVHTNNSSFGSMRLLFPGGRAAEQPGEVGAAALGARTLEESGTVADFSNQQIELFAMTTGLCVEILCDREHIRVDCSYPVSDKDGLDGNLQLMHLLLREPRWDAPIFDRAQLACRAKSQEASGSLELATEEALLSAMYPNDPRVLEPSPELLGQLSLSGVRSCIERQVFDRLGSMEITIVQDFELLGRALSSAKDKARRLTNDEGEAMSLEEHQAEAAMIKRHAERELEEGLWRYLGSIKSGQDSSSATSLIVPFEPAGQVSLEPQRWQQVHLRDPEERANAIVGGAAPNRWGRGDAYHSDRMRRKGFRWDWDASRQPNTSHRLYPSMCLQMLQTILNGRLNGSLRDRLSLAYSASFELSMFDLVDGGWFQATLSAHPSRIKEAVAATKRVIADVQRYPISKVEVAGARQMLQRRHENDLQTNEYWVSLLSHLQTDATCIRDFSELLTHVRFGDVQNAYKCLLTDEEDLFVAVGTQDPH